MHMGMRLTLGKLLIRQNEAGRNGSISGRYPGSMKIEGGDKFHCDGASAGVRWQIIYESDSVDWVSSNDPAYVHEAEFVIKKNAGGPFSWFRFSFDNSDNKGGDIGPGHGGRRLSIYDIQLFDCNNQIITFFKADSKSEQSNNSTIVLTSPSLKADSEYSKSEGILSGAYDVLFYHFWFVCLFVCFYFKFICAGRSAKMKINV